jgi:glutaredoxin-like protein NrdH
MQPPVKVYTLSTCPHCKATKQFLDQCSVKYEFTDVDLLTMEEQRAVLAEVRKINELCSFPTIIIGEKVIVGHDEQAIKEALGM